MRQLYFYIETLGCKVNQYESQVIREGFLKYGYLEADTVEAADICVINSCTVTSNSDSKSLKLMRNAVKKHKCVIATGCMVEGNDIDLSKLIGVRFIVKNQDKYRIPEILKIDHRPETKDKRFGISGLKGHTRVFVKVQDGCDNACAYCKVRIVRGYSRSRPLKEILSECETLIKNGSKEIVLSGICLGAYGKDLSDKIDLCKLIEELCNIRGTWRLRLSSIEPKDIKEELVRLFQTEEKLCKHLHIPFQSGDDDILKSMNRPYKNRDYLDIVKRLKDAVLDIAISSDIMIGFPGETEARFQNTLNLINDIRPMRLHIFPFSKRKGTAAYHYRDDVTSHVKKERGLRLSQFAKELSKEFINKFLDKDAEVLIEHKRSNKGYLQGYSDRYVKVFIDGPDNLRGQIVNLRLTLTNHKVHGILPLYSFCSPF